MGYTHALSRMEPEPQPESQPESVIPEGVPPACKNAHLDMWCQSCADRGIAHCCAHCCWLAGNEAVLLNEACRTGWGCKHNGYDGTLCPSCDALARVQSVPLQTGQGWGRALDPYPGGRTGGWALHLYPGLRFSGPGWGAVAQER